MAAAIRTATEADSAAIAELWHQCGLVRPWNDPRADIARCLAQSQSALLVAERDGRIVASVMVGDDGHRGWLYYVAVDPERRRAGLGRRLVRQAEAWLAARGVVKVELLIRADNAAVQVFYEALGYTAKRRVVMDRWLVEPPMADRG